MLSKVTTPSIASAFLSKEALDLTIAQQTWKALEWGVLQSQPNWLQPPVPLFAPPQPVPCVPLP